MTASAPTTSAPITSVQHTQRPPWLITLAVYSLVLGIITGIPQLYYVLFATGLVPIGPQTNPLGEVWYWYILSGDNTYRHVDPGVLAGAIEDAFLLGPLYLATGIGLWLRKAWVVPVGLITGAMIFYAIVGFFLSDIFARLPTVTTGLRTYPTSSTRCGWCRRCSSAARSSRGSVRRMARRSRLKEHPRWERAHSQVAHGDTACS
jgi:hypothetical protein